MPEVREHLSVEQDRTNAVGLMLLGLVLCGAVAVIELPGGWRWSAIALYVAVATVYVVRCPIREHWVEADRVVERTRDGTRTIALDRVGSLRWVWVPRGADLVELRENGTGVVLRIMILDESAALRREIGRRLREQHPGTSFDDRAMRALFTR